MTRLSLLGRHPSKLRRTRPRREGSGAEERTSNGSYGALRAMLARQLNTVRPPTIVIVGLMRLISAAGTVM